MQRDKVTAIVAQTAGIILTLFGFVKSWDQPNWIHLAIPAFLIILGVWGFLASWKHYERSRLSVQRLRQCRKRLESLSGIELSAMNEQAELAHKTDMGKSWLNGMRTHYIWKAFNIFIIVLGTIIFIYLGIHLM